MMVESRKLEQVRGIYGMLNHILWQCERSEHYNYTPWSKGEDRELFERKEDGWEFFESELSEVEEAAQYAFVWDTDTLDKLERIIGEVRRFVKSFETPGVAKRWLEINPKLNYFDPVYDVIEEDPDTYLKVENGQFGNGETTIHFGCHPTVKDLLERKAYFDAIKKENEEQNNQFSEERIFQNEVVRTLGMVMAHDFPELR